ILSSRLGKPGSLAAAAAASASRTVGSLGNNSGGRPSEAPGALACGDPGTQAGLRSPDAQPAWSPRATRAPGSGSCFAPSGGRAKSSLQTPSRRLEEVAEPAPSPQRLPARIPGLKSRGRPGPGRDAGRSRALCHERRLATRGPALLFPAARGVPAKRLLDADDAAAVAAKCPRLSECSSPRTTSAPGSPCSPQPPPAAPGTGGGSGSAPGPSRIADYLLLPLAEREHVSRALCIHTGRELRCKVFPIKHYQDKIRPYIQLPSHSNITGIVEVILGETKAYVFFEKDFGDMHSYVRSRKRLREEEAARLFKQIVSAVAHCHQSAVVLGDLKLRKFVFSTEERTQLRLESLEDTHIIKGEDDALSDKHGCPAYVSPEILNTTGTYSGKAADVWSLGVMLYTLLVGRYPFHDSDPSALFSKIRRGQFCIPEHISPKARCLIRSLLRREPSERLTAPEILLHPWFESVLEPGYIDSEIGTSDQIVPEYQEDSDISSFFC
uniref:Tribbles homolog 1 n=4 Tax=Catarrhini TaxID=9526 RepID=A0A2K5W687_MACFA